MIDNRQPIETAPKNMDILVWFDHDADPYQDPDNPDKLSNYATWAEAGDYYTGKGFAIAKWFPQHWEAEDEYGNGFWMPAGWFAKHNDDYEFAVNALYWWELPDDPPIR